MGPSPSAAGGGNSPVDKNTDAVRKTQRLKRLVQGDADRGYDV